jgi:hypothetical protein
MTPRTVVLLLTLSLVAAAPAAAQRASDIPRTTLGRPNLQGNWTNSTLTPFQRAEDRAATYTPAEVEAIERGTDDCPANPGTVACGRAEARGPSDEARLTGNEYNEVYWERGQHIAVIRGEPRASLITRPANGRIPALTAAAERRVQEQRRFRSQFEQYDHPELRPLSERCILVGSPLGPPMIPVGAYNSNYVIVQTADQLMIETEMIHDVRIIQIGEPRPPPKDVRPYFGYSSGRWEGDALVVETTNISPGQSVGGSPLSADAKVTERFTLLDPETILYEFTVNDPATYAEPWGGEIPISRLHAELYEYGCHEGNYALSAVLSGARYEESQAEEN